MGISVLSENISLEGTSITLNENIKKLNRLLIVLLTKLDYKINAIKMIKILLQGFLPVFLNKKMSPM